MTMPRKPYLTDGAHRVIGLAHDIADRRGDKTVTPVHLLLGLLERREGVAVAVLDNRDVPLDALTRDLESELPPQRAARRPPASRSWTPEDEQILEECTLEARELGTPYYGTEHLFLALLRNPAEAPSQLLARYGVSYSGMRAEVRRILGLA
jgi:ATP-dependent Clp protease ATP-binding subunit ClpC